MDYEQERLDGLGAFIESLEYRVKAANAEIERLTLALSDLLKAKQGTDEWTYVRRADLGRLESLPDVVNAWAKTVNYNGSSPADLLHDSPDGFAIIGDDDRCR